MIRGAVLAIFVLSGAAGLIYEVVWARQLVLVFGNTTQAVSAILTGFFGGMAIGSWFGGRYADRVGSPLRLYGVIEIVLVVIVLVTPISFRLIHEVYRNAFGVFEGAPQALALVRFALALVALGPATILMGATLPALTRHLARGGAGLSGAFGRLYAANTFGAVAGTLAAGLVLIELLGMRGALAVGAACSGIAGIVALALARLWPLGSSGGRPSPEGEPFRPASTAAPSESCRDAAGRVGGRPRPRLALGVAFVSGMTALGYQVLWTRLLASGTGNSTYVFTMILAVFLTGIALGAVLFSLSRPWIRRPLVLLAWAQLAVAVLALGGLVTVIANPPLVDPARALETLGVLWGTVLPVVLPATIVMGLSFPASSALLSTDEGRIAERAGSLLAANTVGAIAGTFVVPFVVIPLVGSPAAVVGLALVNAGTAVALAVGALDEHRSRVRLVTAGAGALVVAVLVAALAVPGRVVDPSTARVEALGGRLVAATEDEIAAVQAGDLHGARQLWVSGTSMTLLTIDARLMPILPLAARPASESAVIVAFGMGSSYRTALIAGLQTDAVELVPSVVDMFDHFYADAAFFRSHPDGRIIVADGRNYLELTDRRYDIVVTDPPPPIESSGASVISSREYYVAGRRVLNPGGVMMQWMPWGSDLEELRAHVRTFRAVFPEVLVAFGPGGYGLFMLGSDEPIEIDEDRVRAVLSRPGVFEDLRSAYDAGRVGDSFEAWVQALPRLTWIEGSAVAGFVGDGGYVTDDQPLPEYFLVRRLFGPDLPRAAPGILRAMAPEG